MAASFPGRRASRVNRTHTVHLPVHSPAKPWPSWLRFAPLWRSPCPRGSPRVMLHPAAKLQPSRSLGSKMLIGPNAHRRLDGVVADEKLRQRKRVALGGGAIGGVDTPNLVAQVPRLRDQVP